jgi:crotonobetainyl-CoA:carnitine CoA-transferase CaiB-like acyl-CoA transferase
MKTRTQAEWVEFFITHNVPGMPMHSVRELVEDPHFLARENLATLNDPELGQLTVPTTPIKLPDQTYALEPAPAMGQQTDEVLSELLGYSEQDLTALRERGVIQ